jgi:hypothetical protein
MSAAVILLLLEMILELEDEDKDEVKPKTYEQIMDEARKRGSRNEEQDAI